ncbi:MAG: hypothetical protein F6J93_06815 [Oscillatoria sp. SIO1A7]|nr:hypothetical protein [Oscillatoria sp. SIO1A7]
MSDMEQDGALWMLKDVYGFKNLPPDGDYKAFIKAVLICAKGDGVLAQEERDWVVGRAAAYRNTGYELAKTYEANEDLLYVLSQAPMLDKGARRMILYVAIQACAADGEYHAEEKAEVQKLAKYLGVAEGVLNQIEQQCVEELKMREQRIAILFPEGVPY